MGLAAAVAALQHQPAPRLLGVLLGAVIGRAQVALPGVGQAVAVGFERGEGAIRQRADLAEAQQAIKPTHLLLGGAADAGHGAAEAGVIRPYVGHDVAQPLAVRAVRLADAAVVAPGGRLSAG